MNKKIDYTEACKLIKSEISMPDIVNHFGYDMHNDFILCPFHNEKTPSMKIYDNNYHCFGCHAHGDIFSFTEEINQCSFTEAVDYINETFGLRFDIAEKSTGGKKKAYKGHNKEKMSGEHFIINGAVNADLLADYFSVVKIYVFTLDKNTGQKYMWLYDEIKGIYEMCNKDMLRGKLISMIRGYAGLGLNYHTAVENAIKTIFSCDTRYIDIDELNNCPEIVIFQNGVLNIDNMALESKTDINKTSGYLCTTMLPVDWIDGEAEAPVWRGYLMNLTKNDLEQCDLIEQLFGALISNDNIAKYKKAVFLEGAGDTGKSRLPMLAEALLGRDNCQAITLERLQNSPFETYNLLGKRLAYDSDTTSQSLNNMEKFKKLSAGDGVTGEKKGEQAITFTFKGMLWFCCNNVPHFRDAHPKEIYNRMLIIPCDNPIPPEKQDPNIVDKLYKERNAIVKRCITAYVRVRTAGRFDIPPKCAEAMQNYKIDNSSVFAFLDECCTSSEPGDTCNNNTTRRVDTIYDVFFNWCRKGGIKYIPSKKDFKNECALYYGKSHYKEIVRSVAGYDYFTFKVKPEALEQYNIMPSERKWYGA